MTMTETQLDLSELQDDGDTLTLDDGRVLRLKVEPDDCARIEDDEDFFGKFAAPVKNRDTGREDRPVGFTGNAEKLHYGPGYYSIWWEPPRDIKRSDEHFKEFRSTVLDILENGYCIIGLEILQGEDAYHRPIVVAAEFLGGNDSWSVEHIQEVVRDLAGELGVL
jgi:hypothetical protein